MSHMTTLHSPVVLPRKPLSDYPLSGVSNLHHHHHQSPQPVDNPSHHGAVLPYSDLLREGYGVQSSDQQGYGGSWQKSSSLNGTSGILPCSDVLPHQTNFLNSSSAAAARSQSAHSPGHHPTHHPVHPNLHQASPFVSTASTPTSGGGATYEDYATKLRSSADESRFSLPYTPTPPAWRSNHHHHHGSQPSVPPPPPPPPPLYFCGRMVQVRSNKNKNEHKKSSNQCNICGKSYARPSTLKTHMRTHSGEKPYHCPTCQKSFSQTANLTAHMRTHSGEKPFRCLICNRQFSQSSSVTTHMRTHSGERPYRCAYCRKAFADSSTLTKHLRIHSGEKPYQCKICLLRFSQSGNLTRHMKVHKNE